MKTNIAKLIAGEGSLAWTLMLAAQKLDLTEAEFLCFCDANNGCCFAPVDLEYAFGFNVQASGPDGLGEKWGVELNDLAQKLDAFPVIQKVALLAALDGYFEQKNCPVHLTNK